VGLTRICRKLGLLGARCDFPRASFTALAAAN
jgi:hypothetical protein